VNLEVTRLNSGMYCARPVGMAGTCGFYPFPWTAQFGRSPSDARNNFINRYKAKIVESKLRGELCN